MPPAAYRDMWNTIGRGLPVDSAGQKPPQRWRPLLGAGQCDPDSGQRQAQGLHVCSHGEPSRQEIQEAEALYAQMRAEEKSGKATIYLRNGRVRYHGIKGWAGALGRLSLTARLGIALAGMVVLGMLPDLLGLEGSALFWTQLGVLSVGALGVMAWFQLRFGAAIKAAEELCE